jgi:hypothetical protein
MTNNELALAKSGVEAVNQNGSVKKIKQDGLMGKHSIINSLAGYSNVNSTPFQGRKSKDSMRDATDAERELKIAKREGWEMFTQFKGSPEMHAKRSQLSDLPTSPNIGLDGGPGDKGSTNFDGSLFTYSNPYELSPNNPESQQIKTASDEFRSHNLAVVNGNGNGFGGKEIERSVKSNQSGSPGSPRSRSRVNIDADLLEVRSNEDALPYTSNRSSPNDGGEDGDGLARKSGHKGGKPKSSRSINKNGKAGGGGKKSHQDARPLGPMTDYNKHSIKNIVHYSSK